MSRPREVIEGPQRLQRATRDLQEIWAATKEHWNDKTARDFEGKYLEPLIPTVRYVLGETSELNEVYRKAIQACSDEQKDEFMF